MEQAILLDTNVLSELMRPQPDVRVLSWFDLNNEAGYYTSAVTQAEILLGILLLPPGKRQTGLADAAAEMFSKDFSGRCLPFISPTGRTTKSGRTSGMKVMGRFYEMPGFMQQSPIISLR
jgi:predicted nucleic acid-binding protein